MWATGHAVEASWIWAIGTIPVVAGLAVSMTRDFLAGRVGVDAIALVSMTAALLLGEALAGIVVAVMYAGGNVLEDFAVARAERDLKSLVDRAPRLAHRRSDHGFEDIPVEQVGFGDVVLVRAGEIVPIDGVVVGGAAVIDESALTGEPIPVTRRTGEPALSGSLNAGETFEMRATATAGASTYAGIVRMVTAAQTAKAPFIRVADRYALLLLPVTLAVAGAAWLLSGDSHSWARGAGRGDAVPADPGGAGRLHRRRVPGGAQRHPHQGWRCPGDRHPHCRRRPAHRRRDRAGGKRRRGAPPRRLPGAGLPSHRRRSDCRG